MLCMWTLRKDWKGVPESYSVKFLLAAIPRSPLSSWPVDSLTRILSLPWQCLASKLTEQERETESLRHLKDTEQTVLTLSLGTCSEGWMSPCPTAYNLESTHSQVFHGAPYMGKQQTGSPVRAGSSLLNKTNHLDPKTISIQPLPSLHCRASPEYTRTQRSLKSEWSTRSLICLQIPDSWACPTYSPLSLSGSNERNPRTHLI